MSVCEILPNISRNLVVVSVYLVAHQNPQYFRRGVLLNFPQPVWTAVECWLVGHVVDQDEGVGRPVVGLGDAPEPGGDIRPGQTRSDQPTSSHYSYLSWPAVSQICSFIFSPSISTVLIMKSTPMVAPWPGGNIPWVNLRTRQVLPTPALPTRTTCRPTQ